MLDPRLTALLDVTRNLEKTSCQMEQAWRQLQHRQEETAAAWSQLGEAFNGSSLVLCNELTKELEATGEEADSMSNAMQETIRRQEELADHAHELWQFCGAILTAIDHAAAKQVAYEDVCEELNLAKSQMLQDEARHNIAEAGQETVTRLESRATEMVSELRAINDRLVVEVQTLLTRLDVRWNSLIEKLYEAMANKANASM